MLDGEPVVLDGEGKSSFSTLQGAFEKGDLRAFTYFVFDLLHLDSYNLRGCRSKRVKLCCSRSSK